MVMVQQRLLTMSGTKTSHNYLDLSIYTVAPFEHIKAKNF